MPRLSKSRIMSSLQCLKRVHLEAHHPDLAEFSPATLAAFKLGHKVGDIAVGIYAGDTGVYLDYEDGLGRAMARTRALLNQPERVPVFEATIQHQGVLVREDVLLPHGDSWRIVEVKASTKCKNEHVQDCAIQAWVHTGAGYTFDRFALAHIDNQFVYRGDGDYRGLLVEEDLTDAVMDLQSSVPAWVDRARQAVAGPMPDVPVGQHCFTPYECPYFRHCWPVDTDYPVHCLKGARKKLGELVMAGYRDIREVPADLLTAEDQLRIRRVTRAGEAELLPAAGEFVRGLAYPRYYLDFETVGPAVPVWADTRPYQVLPFQYSCHIEAAPGKIRHVEFLDMTAAPPMRALAEQLIADLGDTGPVLMYTAYEKGVINGLTERFPDLAPALQAIAGRLVDLYPVTKTSYYHPDMLGSWSIKAVLPTIAPDMDYEMLAGVKEGTEASNAYLGAIGPDGDPEETGRVRRELLDYCRFDTLAMVRLVEYFSRH
jgi:hypothetical protein